MNKDELIDRIAKNATVLGKMSARVEKCETKPWLTREIDEVTIKRFYEIRSEQIKLIEMLKKKIRASVPSGEGNALQKREKKQRRFESCLALHNAG